MNEDKHSEDIDFTLYDHIKEFTIGEIAKLWCGIDISAPIPPEKLPEAKAIGIKIIGAIKSKELKCKFPSPEYFIDKERRRIIDEIISEDMLSHDLWASQVIDKKDLRKWANENGYRLKFLFPGKKEISSSASTVKDEAACQSWLEELMSNSSQQEENKSYYQKQALSKFNTGINAFNRVWANAIVKTGNTNWGKPGRKKSRP